MKRDDADHNLGYFKIHPAEMWEAMCRLNPCDSINATLPHFGPLLYAMASAIPAFNVLEIGVAGGYSAGFMAWAVKQNNTRFGMTGRYYGIDIDNKDHLQKDHDEIGLPTTFIHHVKGSVDYLINQTEWTPGTFDLIFIDGLHYVPYLEREINLVYPLLKGNGAGYLCLHDVSAFVEKIWPKVIEMKAPDIKGDMKPAWEHIRFIENYGFGILRKMEGWDHDKIFWPSGDQKEYAALQGVL